MLAPGTTGAEADTALPPTSGLSETGSTGVAEVVVESVLAIDTNQCTASAPRVTSCAGELAPPTYLIIATHSTRSRAERKFI